MGGPEGPLHGPQPLCADERWISSSRPALRGPAPGRSAVHAAPAAPAGAALGSNIPEPTAGTTARRRETLELLSSSTGYASWSPQQTEARELTSTEKTPSDHIPAPELERAETGAPAP